MTHRELLEIVEEAILRDMKRLATFGSRLPLESLATVLRERLGDDPPMEAA